MTWPYRFAQVLTCVAVLSMSAPYARGSEGIKLQKLVSELKNPRISDESTAQLEKLVKPNPSLRIPLARSLRPIISSGPEAGKAWSNALKLAGVLKMDTLAPDIAPYVGRTGTYLIGALSEQYPAGASLKEIGDPAIPALMRVAESGDAAQRDAAPMVISWIGTPKARRALQVLLRHETNPDRRKRIESLLKTMPRKP